MKNLQLKYKFPLLLIINTIPFALNVIFYRAGGLIELSLFLLAVVVLSSLNLHCFNKALHYLIVQLYQLACLIGSACIATHLYYNNVSSDTMTSGLGMAIVILFTVILSIITIVTATLTYLTKK